MADYLRPARLGDALSALAERRYRPLAGGTDFYPAESVADGWQRPGLAHAGHPPTLDLDALDELRGVRQVGGQTEIGALLTWRDATATALPGWFDGVRLAAREIGGAQIQNRGTLVGNLCNASPAADGVPPLLALDARLRLQSHRGRRELPLSDFLAGNRQTALADDELVTHILITNPPADARSTFLKLGARRYLVISIVMVAATVVVDGRGAVSRAAVAVGACSAVAQRLERLERRLLGRPLDAAAGVVRDDDFDALRPISDPRASEDYRRRAAAVLVRRALTALSAGHVAGRAA